MCIQFYLARTVEKDVLIFKDILFYQVTQKLEIVYQVFKTEDQPAIRTQCQFFDHILRTDQVVYIYQRLVLQLVIRRVQIYDMDFAVQKRLVLGDQVAKGGFARTSWSYYQISIQHYYLIERIGINK